jgi:hypothetical protein
MSVEHAQLRARRPSGRLGPFIPLRSADGRIQAGSVLSELFLVGAVTMIAAQTLTRERICEPIRRRCGSKETWLGYLVSCPYCASHWFALALVPLTGTYPIAIAPRWGAISGVLEWLVNSLAVVAVAAFFRVLFYFVDESQGLVRRHQARLDSGRRNGASTRRRNPVAWQRHGARARPRGRDTHL